MERVLEWLRLRGEECPTLEAKQYPFIRDVDYEAWRESRFDYIGASTVPAIIGLNHYKSRIAMWREYVARKSDYQDNAYTISGHWNEPLIQYLTEQQNPQYTIYPYNLSHIGAEGFNSATPDGLVTVLAARSNGRI